MAGCNSWSRSRIVWSCGAKQDVIEGRIPDCKKRTAEMLSDFFAKPRRKATVTRMLNGMNFKFMSGRCNIMTRSVTKVAINPRLRWMTAAMFRDFGSLHQKLRSEDNDGLTPNIAMSGVVLATSPDWQRRIMILCSALLRLVEWVQLGRRKAILAQAFWAEGKVTFCVFSPCGSHHTGLGFR